MGQTDSQQIYTAACYLAHTAESVTLQGHMQHLYSEAVQATKEVHVCTFIVMAAQIARSLYLGPCKTGVACVACWKKSSSTKLAKFAPVAHCSSALSTYSSTMDSFSARPAAALGTWTPTAHSSDWARKQKVTATPFAQPLTMVAAYTSLLVEVL